MVSHPFVQYQNKHLNASHTHLDTKQAGIANQEQRTGTASIWVAYCYCSSLCQDYEAKTHKMWNARATAYSQSNTLSNNRAASKYGQFDVVEPTGNDQFQAFGINLNVLHVLGLTLFDQLECSRCLWNDSFGLVRILDTSA